MATIPEEQFTPLPQLTDSSGIPSLPGTGIPSVLDRTSLNTPEVTPFASGEKLTSTLNSLINKRDKFSDTVTAKEKTVLSAYDNLQSVIAADDARRVNNESALVSDAQAISPLGTAANLAVGLGSKTGDVIRSFIAAPFRFARVRFESGITSDEFALYESAVNKTEQREILNSRLSYLIKGKDSLIRDKQITEVLNKLQQQRLTPEEEFITSPESVVKEGLTIAQRIGNAKRLDEFLSVVDSQSKISASRVNTRETSIALDKVKDSAEQSVTEFTKGNHLQGVGTFLEGVSNLATEDTIAATQLLVEAIPHMVAMVQTGAFYLPAVATELHDKAVEAYREEHEESPTPEEESLIGLLSVANAGMDRVASGISLQSVGLVRGILKSSTTLSQRVPNAILTGLSRAGAPVGSAVVEGSTEGAQNVLEQISKSIRDPKVDPVPALVDTAVGSVIGTAFSAPSVARDIVTTTTPAVNAAKQVTKKVAERATTQLTELGGSLQEAINKSTDVLIKENSQSDPEAVMDRIVSDGLDGLDAEARFDRIKVLATLNKEAKDTAIDSGTEYQDKNEAISNLIAAHKERKLKERTGKTTTEHVANIADDTESDTKAESLTEINTAIKEGKQLPLAVLETVSGSTLFKEANPKQVSAITEEIKLRKKLATVSQDIQEGSPGFKGLNEYVEEVNSFIELSDSGLVQSSLTALASFKTQQANKLAAFQEAQESIKDSPVGTRVSFTYGNDREAFYEKGRSDGLVNTIKNDLNSITSILDSLTTKVNAGIETSSAVTPQSTKASAVVVEESNKPVPKKLSVLETIKQPLTNDSDITQSKINALNIIGSNKGKLPTEFETRRNGLIARLGSVSRLDEGGLKTLNQDLRTFLKDVRAGAKPKVSKDTPKKEKAVTEASSKPESKIGKDVIVDGKQNDLKGTHNKNLTDNLLNESLNSTSLNSHLTLKENKGTNTGAKTSDVFKSTSIENPGLFNINHNFFSRYRDKGFTKAMVSKMGKVSKDELLILDSLSDFNSSFGSSVESLISFLDSSNRVYSESKSGTLSSLDQNPLGYLVKQDSTGKRYINENITGLMSTVMYDWLGTRATSTLFNTSGDINSILGRDSDAKVWPDEHTALRYIGSSRTVIAETLGRAVVKQLGLTTTENVDGNMLDRLGMSIGLTMVAAGVKNNILEEHFLDKATYATFLKRDTSSTIEGRATPFIRLVAKPDDINKAPEFIDNIIGVTRNSTELLDRVFGVESNNKFVATEPVTKVVSTIGNTSQILPKVFKDAIRSKQKVVWEVKENLHKIVTTISRESLERIAGVTDPKGEHVSEVEGTEAKNTDIGRLLDKYNTSISKLDNEGGMFQDIFFEYKTDDNLRSRIVNNMLNPVGNKIHRHLVGARSWNTTVPSINTKGAAETRSNFKLAVAQAFGYSIDKNSTLDSENEFDRLILDKDIKKGITAIRKIQQGGSPTPLREESIEAAVRIGGEALHTLDGLIALASYNATEGFETNLGLEVDGVTNGLAIGLMQAPIEENIDQLLSSVGIFLNGKEGTSYPEWASVPGNLDLYQRLVSDWIGRLNATYPNDPTLASLEELVGAFVTQEIVQDTVEDTVTSLGRSFAKEPMMFTSYGSSIQGAVSELSTQFLSKIYGRLQSASKSEDVTQATKDVVNGFYSVLEIPVPSGIDFTKPLKITFSTSDIQIFNGIVSNTYGESLQGALDNTFSDFFQFRDSVNTMTAVMYEVFIAKYIQEIDIKQKKVGSRKLSTKEQREVFDSLQKYQPLIKSAYSTNLDDSFLIIKETNSREYGDKQSTVQITLGEVEGINNASMTGVVSHSRYETPGAKALTTLTQGQDAAIQTKNKLNYDFLDIFDAKILAVDKVNIGTKLTNEQMWDVTTDYSVMDTTHESFKRVIALAIKEPKLRKAALRGVNARRSKDNQLTVNQFNKEIIGLKTRIAATRKKIKDTPNVIVSQFAHTTDSTFVANPIEATETKIPELVDNVFDEIVALQNHLNNDSGSSITPIDFDNFNSQFDATLTANNTLDVFDKMASFGNKRESSKHTQHLKNVLTGVVNKVLRPIDAIEYKVGDTTKETHGAAKGSKVYINASTANRLNNNNEISLQETQVHELLHVVLNHGIDNNFGARKRLRKLFNTVDKGIRDIYGEEGWKIFMHTDSNNNNLVQLDQATEEKAARARYNYIFNNTRVHLAPGVDPLTQKNRDKQFNDSLKEFVAFGLTNESFMSVLGEIDTRTKKDTSDLSLQDKLNIWFNSILDWINSLLGKPQNLKTDTALRSVVNQLVITTNKQRNGTIQLMDSIRDFNGAASTALYNNIVKPIIDWRIDQAKRPETIIGKVSDVISTIPLAYHNTEYRNKVKQVLRLIGLTEERFLVKLVRELQGTKASNLVWHSLLRQSKHLVDSARKKVSDGYRDYLKQSFVGGLPSKEESIAMTRVVYKSDMSSLLDTHTIPKLIQILRNEGTLDNDISKLTAELSVFGSNQNYYTTQAEGLGNLIATGRNPSKIQAFNAHNIANLILDTRANKAKVIGDVVKAEEVIDRLATLYALKAMPMDNKGLVANVMERENNANNQDNGIISTLQVHKNFKEDSLAQLFDGNKIQTVKGYTHETFNPRTDVKVASVADEADLLEQGYVAKEGTLLPDPKNPNQTVNKLYVLKDAVGLTRLKGIVSLTGKVAKGSSLLDGHVSLKSLTPKQDAIRDRDRYIRNSQLDVSRQFNGTFKFKNEATLIPIVDDKGNITEFRYIMDESTKVELLERDDRFDVVMGNMYGGITDKLNSRQVNKKVLELAYEDFQTGFASDPNAYVSIKLNSTEKRYKELYSLIPEDMRRDMVTIWGKKEIQIRRELADLIFGYKKWSVTEIGKGIPSMDRVHKLLNTAKVRHIEAVWQEVVSVAKTNIVIRTPTVLADNFISNAILSLTKGVSLPFMVKNQALAIRALNEYQKELRQRDLLEIELKTASSLTTKQRTNLQARVNDLTSDLTNNPVSDLIDEGVFQAITEDLEDSRSPYNFRDKLLTDLKLDKIANSDNDLVRNATQQAFMTEETSIFKLLMKATQYSDFIARFALHTHNVEVKGMDKDESLKDVIETFINYDIPTSVQLQYMNDMGFFMFTKFMFRIQKVIFTLLKDRPVSVGVALLTQQVFGDVPDILDSLGISLGGRVGFFLGPADTATDISGLKNLGEVVGFN